MAFFKKYEFIIAWRYLMSKRREGGISIIAWYALIGGFGSSNVSDSPGGYDWLQDRICRKNYWG